MFGMKVQIQHGTQPVVSRTFFSRAITRIGLGPPVRIEKGEHGLSQPVLVAAEKVIVEAALNELFGPPKRVEPRPDSGRVRREVILGSNHQDGIVDHLESGVIVRADRWRDQDQRA